ncbi:5856_t:CDS:2, partial [Dentiscutata heterogama]
MPDIFSKIPYELVVKVLTFLPAKDLCSVSLKVRFCGCIRKLWILLVDQTICSENVVGLIHVGSSVNKNLLSFTQDDYVWRSICINQFPASRISEEQKNMIPDEDTSKVQETNNSDNQSGPSIFGTIVSSVYGLANLVLNTPSVESNSNEQQVTVSEHSEWKRLYKRLSKHINFIAKERCVTWLDCQDGGGTLHHWRTIEDSQSEFGSAVYLEYVWWFDVSSNLKSVLPGTYDVVWRLKMEEGNYRRRYQRYHPNNVRNLNFSTTLEDEIDAETAIHDEQRYEHMPQPEMYTNLARKNKWVEYCLPYKIVVPERKVVDGKLVYHDVYLKIYNHEGFLKSGL